MPRFNYRDQSTVPPLDAQSGGIAAWVADRPYAPYFLPFAAYLLIMAPGSLGDFWQHLWLVYNPLIYAVKSAIAAILIWLFYPYYTRIRWTHLPLGILAGLFGTVLWIATEYACQSIHLTHPPNPAKLYNPDLMLRPGWPQWTYLSIRVIGPTLVVPFMEELFFRDFLTRTLINRARFEDVPIGQFTWPSFLLVAGFFGINHGGQWPEGILYGMLMALLLIRTKSLGACILAHGITNWTLYLYVIYTGDWQFM